MRQSENIVFSIAMLYMYWCTDEGTPTWCAHAHYTYHGNVTMEIL